MKTVIRKDWKNRPMPERRARIPVEREFSLAEMERIKIGYLPAEMEEKWFVYFSRNRLYMHRSWTGFCIYIGHFKRKRDGFLLHLVEANRLDAQYAEKDDAFDAQLCMHLIEVLLLGREKTPYPERKYGSPEEAAISQWKMVGKVFPGGGAGNVSDSPEDDEDREPPEVKTDEAKPSGFVAALEQASKPNYLGDPKVVGKLLKDFGDEALKRRASGMDDEEANISDDDCALAIANVFLGKVPAYAPMIPWNSPGQIDRWLADECKELKVAAETPELTVANVLTSYLKDILSFASLAEEDKNWNIDATLENFTNVMLGISIRDDMLEDDEPTEDDDKI